MLLVLRLSKDGSSLTGVPLLRTSSLELLLPLTMLRCWNRITLDVTSGIITAVNGFVGNVTGNATGLSGTPDITVRNVTGVAATFTGV